jgi:hypothetical protein
MQMFTHPVMRTATKPLGFTRKIHPKFFMPVHGYHYMLRVHGDIAREANNLTEDEVIIPDNGSIIEIQDGGKKIVKLKEKAPSGIVMVDGFSVGDIQDVVIRDRQMLAQDGIFIVFAIINAQTGKLKKSPDIISRGFVYLRESQELLHQARIIIKNTVEESTKGMNPINIDYVKTNVSDNISKYLFQKTAKRPIVIPVLLTRNHDIIVAYATHPALPKSHIIYTIAVMGFIYTIHLVFRCTRIRASLHFLPRKKRRPHLYDRVGFDRSWLFFVPIFIRKAGNYRTALWLIVIQAVLMFGLISTLTCDLSLSFLLSRLP